MSSSYTPEPSSSVSQCCAATRCTFLQRLHGARVIGTVKALPGPEAGPGSVFFFTEAPWGLRIELISYPNGKAYEKPGYAPGGQGLTAPASVQ